MDAHKLTRDARTLRHQLRSAHASAFDDAGEVTWRKRVHESARRLVDTREFVGPALDAGDPLDRLIAAEIIIGEEMEGRLTTGASEEDRVVLEGLLNALASISYRPSVNALDTTESCVMRLARALWEVAARSPGVFAEAVSAQSLECRRRAVAACCELGARSLLVLRCVCLEDLRLGYSLVGPDVARAAMRAVYTYLGVRYYAEYRSLAEGALGHLSLAAEDLLRDLETGVLEEHGGTVDEPMVWWCA